MLVVDQRDQQMFERRIFVPAAAGLPKRVVKGLFELASETGHLSGYSPVRDSEADMVNNVIRSAPPIKTIGPAFPQIIAGMAAWSLNDVRTS
jgi:hypothetical protein